MTSKIVVEIVDRICQEFQVSKDDLLSPRRTKKLAFARQVGMYLLRQQDWTLQEIAWAFHRKNHTTVVYALEKKDVKKRAELMGIPTVDVHDTKILNPTKTIYRQKNMWLFEKYEPKCLVCGFDDVIEIHHIISPKYGGKETSDNLLILCPNHHSMLHGGLLKINGIHLPGIPRKDINIDTNNGGPKKQP